MCAVGKAASHLCRVTPKCGCQPTSRIISSPAPFLPSKPLHYSLLCPPLRPCCPPPSCGQCPRPQWPRLWTRWLLSKWRPWLRQLKRWRWHPRRRLRPHRLWMQQLKPGRRRRRPRLERAVECAAHVLLNRQACCPPMYSTDVVHLTVTPNRPNPVALCFSAWATGSAHRDVAPRVHCSTLFRRASVLQNHGSQLRQQLWLVRVCFAGPCGGGCSYRQ